MSTASSPFTYGPSPEDQRTLRGLGLDPVRRAPRAYAWLDFGTVAVEEGEGGTVQIEASYAPATFWRFTITSAPGTDWEAVTILETGSGSLAEFWPIARQFAVGMLAVASVDRKAER